MSVNATTDNVVLVIEDDLPLQGVLSEALTEAGYRVVTAGMGGEGLMQLGMAPPSLVTLDLRLPDVSGGRVLELLRAYADTSNLPVVIVSAASSIPAQIRDLADAVVSKPFDIDELLTTIRRLMPPPVPKSSTA
jgi:DNA-binding response OmpR family regulator